MNRPLAAVLLVLLHAFAPASAKPVTPDRVAALPAAERAAWQDYMARSQAAARADQAALDAELAAAGMTVARQAPDGGDFKLPAKAGDAWYAREEAARLADVILSYQTPSGGWSKHTGYAKGPRTPGTQWTSQNKPGQPPHYLATFDNRSTTEQLYFLAYVAHATDRADCRAAFLRGLDFVLAAQYPNGGWPQVYPLEGGYHDDVTFNDNAMTHVLGLLRDVGAGGRYFAFVDAARRERAAAALSAGVACVGRLQVERDGRRTVWCAQNDPLTLRPSAARAMEPATLSGLESARIFEFLMTLENPSPEIVATIEDGLAWCESARIKGIRKVERDGKATYEADATSPEVYWARFYDLTTGRPVFPGRDGAIYESYEAMAAVNATGYDYYTTIPGGILNSRQKQWRKMLARRPATAPAAIP